MAERATTKFVHRKKFVYGHFVYGFFCSFHFIITANVENSNKMQRIAVRATKGRRSADT